MKNESKKERLKTCFFIAPIGHEGSEARKRSDQVLNHIIKPIAEECGYEAIRADEISKPGIITSQIIQHLLDDDLVIADLTGQNPNVFYELAIRHTVRKPFVQIIQSGEPIPFDIAPTRTIYIDHRDLDSVARCKEELIKQIHAAEKDPDKVDSPISMAIDLKSLYRSQNPLEKSNAEILSMLKDLLASHIDLRHTILQEIFPSNISSQEEEEALYKAREAYYMTNMELRKADEALDIKILELFLERAQELADLGSRFIYGKRALYYKASEMLSEEILRILQNPEVRSRLRKLREMGYPKSFEAEEKR